MEGKVTSRYKLVMFIPLVLGILIDNINFISKLYADLFWLISILFTVFWFWTGKVFARLSENKVKGFIIGNSLWLISFMIFWIWLYLPGTRHTTNIFLEGFSQYYVIGMIPIVSEIAAPPIIYTGAGQIKAAYVFMFMVFAIGFSYELFWKMDKVKLIITAFLFTIIFVPLMVVSGPYWTHAVKDNGTFVKESYEEIKSYHSAYSTNGFSLYLFLEMEDGKIDYQLTNPKGEIIFKGYAVKENGKLNRQLIYPENYEEGYWMIKPPNIPGKYTLTIKPSSAIGEYDVVWEDTPAPLM